MQTLDMSAYLRLKLPINSEYVVDNISYRTQSEYYAVVKFAERDVERSLKRGFDLIVKQFPVTGKEVTFYPSDLFIEEINYEQKRN